MAHVGLSTIAQHRSARMERLVADVSENLPIGVPVCF
jgi:hypothetical protein